MRTSCLGILIFQWVFSIIIYSLFKWIESKLYSNFNENNRKIYPIKGFLQNMENDANAEEITLFCVSMFVRFIRQDFGCNISRSTNVNVNIMWIIYELSQTKIDQFKVWIRICIIVRKHNILRLQVSVHNT